MAETENPYETSDKRVVSERPAGDPNSTETAWRELRNAGLFTAACGFLGGTVGVLVGAGLGLMMPDYYRSVFARGQDPAFDPLAVGIGLGISQGLVAGAGVGVALVAVYYWQRTRRR